MSFSLKFLGTGTSVGVPQIGCSCPTCTSTDARDRRCRSGAYVTSSGGAAFLIDTPPELRLACVEYGIAKVDAVVLTHMHMDHVAGFDDVRRFNTLNGEKVPCDPSEPGANGRSYRIVGRPMPCYGAPETIESIQRLFPYVSAQPNAQGLFRPQIVFTPVNGPFRIGDVVVTPFAVEHGPRTNGYLLEAGGRRLAYASDCARLPPESLDLVRGVDVLVLDCLRDRAHPTHFNREGALACAAATGARRVWLTHLCHEVKHAEFEATLPPHVRLAYDGLALEI